MSIQKITNPGGVIRACCVLNYEEAKMPFSEEQSVKPEEKEKNMANCAQMEKGDVYVCEKCGLELQVIKTCACIVGEQVSCNVPLQCCGQDMKKK